MSEYTAGNGQVSPELALAVQEYLIGTSKLEKLFLSALQKLVIIQSDFSKALFSLSEECSKEVSMFMKKNKFANIMLSNSSLTFYLEFYDQINHQSSLIQDSCDKLRNTIINPLSQMFDSKKIVRKACYNYADSYASEIKKKQDDLMQKFLDYAEISSKCSKGGKSTLEKDIKKMDNVYNTYLLRVSAVNTMHQLHYKHVLPKIFFNLQNKENDLSKFFPTHICSFVNLYKDLFQGISKSFELISQKGNSINNFQDLNQFVETSFENFFSSKEIPVQEFIPPSIKGKKRASIVVPKSKPQFILNSLTHATLQHHYLSLQKQSNQLLDAFDKTNENATIFEEDIKSIQHQIARELHNCDKEANLKVLLEQMELYTPFVLDFLGPQEGLLEAASEEKKLKRNSSGKSFLPDQMFNSPLMKSFRKPKKKMSRAVSKESSIDVEIEPSKVLDVVDYDILDGFDSDEFDETYEQPVDYQKAKNWEISISSQSNSFESPPKVDRSTKRLSSISVISDSFSHFNTFDEVSDEKESIYVNKKPAIAPKPSVAKKKPIVARKPSAGTLSRKIAEFTDPNSPLPPTPDEKQIYCLAMYDFHSDVDDQLSFTAGTKIKVIDNSNDIWWYGELNACQGYIPEQYVLVLKEDDEVLRCLYDFTAADDKEMSVFENDIVIKIADEDEWVLVRSVNKQGLVPASYVEYCQ